MAHRLAHRHAVGVDLVEPVRIELADERARAEEGRLVALPFLLGEGDDLERERQAPAGPVQLAHADHRHEDAEAAVVLAAVAHGVEVRSGQQALRGSRRGGAIDADDVADGIDLDLSKPHSRIQRTSCAGAGAVRVGEVGDGELAVLGEARVGMPRQQLGAVPRLLAEHRLVAEAVVEAQLGDAVDVAQPLVELEVGMVLEPALEGGDDLRLGQPVAARPAHGQHEREAELLVVGGVEALQRRELLGRARVRPALPCSCVDSAVIALAIIALPASSGWARSSARCSSRLASASVSTRARLSCARSRTGGAAQARSATHGECS